MGKLDFVFEYPAWDPDVESREDWRRRIEQALDQALADYREAMLASILRDDI